ncbi:MAG: hypothetical protein CME65_12145 [Halobacteriovoraceae bacterium]|nr:hypothetical protein [Halobacteriovoraceae bacterium]|tara:strand:- start:8255 stop:9292 length:1038 start_codon:yes stop_codon:yes gene_type:complete
MALRILLVLIFSFNFSAMAQSRSQKRFLSLATKSHSKKDYARSNEYIRKAFDVRKTKNIPSTALYLYAVNLQKLGRHKESIYYLNRMIKRNYLKAHIASIKMLKNDEIDGDEIPKLLKATYFYMAQSYYAIFNSTQDKVYAERSRKFFKICYDSDFSDKCSDFIENIDAKLDVIEKSKKSFEFFLFAGRIMFNDRVQIKNNDTGASATILSASDGLCYGAGLRLQNYYKGWQFSGCAFSGYAGVNGEIDSTNYKQLGVPVAGLYAEGGYFWRTDSESTRLGLTLPIFYRSGLYSQPTGYSIENSRTTSFGMAVSAGFQLPVVELEIKLANMQETNIAMMNLVFNF